MRISERSNAVKLCQPNATVIIAAAAGLILLPGAGALAAKPTPAQPRGPFYPNTLPQESDADLARFAGQTAKGQPILVTGRVLTRDGNPLANTKVEIWQTNANGRYHHERDDSPAALDPGFQGWGQITTGADGTYRFRTIEPRAYSGRTPHIHFAVTAPGKRVFYTQLYFAGSVENDADFLLRQLAPDERKQLMTKVEPSSAGADPQARFDIVLP